MTSPCPNCGSPTSPEAFFCNNCGTDLRAPHEESAPADPESQAAPGEPGATQQPSEDQLAAVQSSVDALRSDLSGLSQRLAAVEQAVNLIRPQPRPATGTERQTMVPPEPAGAQESRPLEQPERYQRAEAGGVPPGTAWAKKAAEWNWEWLLGGNWLARIGALALVIGAGFFLKLAVDNNWIGETGRIILGLVVGAVLLGGGEYWRKKYPLWAHPLSGAGIGIWYLTVFAAFALFDLIGPIPALLLFSVITLAAAGLALRYESRVIAVLGIIGGFITPLMLNERLPDQRLLLAYVLILDLGVLALSTFRNWRWFTLLALLGSLGLYGFWLSELDPGLWLAQSGITVIFLIFVGATTLFHVLWRRAAGPMDQALMVVNAAAYFGISYALLFEEYRAWMGGFTLLLAAFYVLLGYGLMKRSREQVYLSLFAIGTGLVFLTIAIPIQLGGPWISVGWAAEGLVLIWLASYLKMPQLRWFGVGTFAIFAAWLLMVDTPDALHADFRPFWNVYLPAYLFSVAISYSAAYLLARQRDSLVPNEQMLFPMFLVGANLFLTVGLLTQVPEEWIAVIWAVEAVVLVGVSLRLSLVEMRLFGLGLLAVTVMRLIVFDTFNVNNQDFTPVLNQRFLSFAVGMGGIYACAFMLRREIQPAAQEWLIPMVRFAVPGLLVAGSFLTLWLLSAEIITTVDTGVFDLPSSIKDDVTSLSLSVLWALYAAGLLVLGMVRQLPRVRQAGLALMAIPVVKLFAFDVFALDQGYRVAAFIGLGVLLLAGGYLYQRHTKAIRGFLFQ